MNILPEEFWNALLNDTYLPEHEGILAFNIENYAALIEGRGYARSLYGSDFHQDWDFFVNIMAIKDICIIIFHLLDKPESKIAVIEYNLHRKRNNRKICYFSYFIKRISRYQDVFHLLQEIKIEFFDRTGFELKEKPIEAGALAGLKTIKTITCVMKWRELIDINSSLDAKKKAEEIAIIKELNLSPVTVASNAIHCADIQVKREASRAYNILREETQDITSSWRELIEKEPQLKPEEKAEIIALEKGINPVTVAGYAKVSKDQVVKSEAYKAYKILLEDKHDITVKWRKLIDNEPELTPRERAEKIGLKTRLDPVTVAGYARISEDREVKSEAIKAYKILLEDKHDITVKWRKLIDNEPELTPRERAEKIGLKTRLNPVSVAGYARISEDREVKSEAIKALKVLFEDKHEITVKWRKLIDNEPELTSRERAEKIGLKTRLNPVSVAGYARISKDREVKSEANKAYKILLDDKRGITVNN